MARTARGGKGPAKSSAKEILRDEKVLRCLEHRKLGLTWDKVAQLEGYATPSGPYKAVMKYLQENRSDAVDEFRATQDTLLDEMSAVFVGDALNPTAELRYEASDQMLKIMERRAKLHGLDTKNLQLGGPNGEDLTLAVVLARGLELMKGDDGSD